MLLHNRLFITFVDEFGMKKYCFNFETLFFEGIYQLYPFFLYNNVHVPII